jgi:tetratricopeptide (TPR) repeat protein
VLRNLFASLVGDSRDALERTLRDAESARDAPAIAAAAHALLARAPRSLAAWLALAKALHGSEEHREAAAAYRKALELGAPPPLVHKQLGVLHAAIGEHAPAIEHLTRAVELDPRDADALCMLGTVMSDTQRFTDATGWYERALAQRPDFPEAHYNLGLARFEQGDFARAVASIDRCIALNRGPQPAAGAEEVLRRDPEPKFAPPDMAVNEIKLKHDCEQIEYLLQIGRLPAAYGDVLEQYRALREEVRGKVDVHSVVPFDAGRYPLVARTYKRPIHIAHEPALEGSLINPLLDFRAIEERYLAAKPSIATLDGLVTPAALQALRRFCLESTIWNNIKPGYLGAYLHDGFCSELLLRLAWEFRERLPRIVRGLPLQVMWGYKCDSSLPGLGVHADAAAVNVNFWITDDSANLDPEHGGLLVYEHDAPLEWGFGKFNKDSDTILAYLESVHSVPVCVPHRANRAVIFDSDLFHASDRPRFREGYANRRVNITLLYGLRTS